MNQPTERIVIRSQLNVSDKMIATQTNNVLSVSYSLFHTHHQRFLFSTVDDYIFNKRVKNKICYNLHSNLYNTKFGA